MKERILRKKEGKAPSLVQAAFHAITVGSGRYREPYIIAFHYKSDNVAGRSLGTLFGFFEVEVHDEDAAYIVNFLASVAKKEYFTNPRRSVSDGFETTLHKVNVALAEIAKEGNVSWLGHLHGILGALSEDTVHFSATGDGVLALVREGTLRPISDGLAEVLSEPHPLKTFTEVASGKLYEDDVLLAISPAVWTLFTPDDLKKNLARLGQQGFEQFLHTALVNELPIAGIVTVHMIAQPAPTFVVAEEKTESPEIESMITNVWSGKAFEKAREKHIKVLNTTPIIIPKELEKKEEYTDKKTGHIYVQGEHDALTEESAWQTRLALWSQTLSHNWQITQEKLYRLGRRSRKNVAFTTRETGATFARWGRVSGRRVRSLIRRVREQHSPSEMPMKSFSLSVPPKIVSKPSLPMSTPSRFSLPPLPNFPKPNLGNISDRFKNGLGYGWQSLRQSLGQLWEIVWVFWSKQERKSKNRILGSIALVFTLLLGTWFYLNRSTYWSTPQPVTPPVTMPTQPPPPTLGADEPLVQILGTGETNGTVHGTQSLVSVNNTIWAVSETTLTNLSTGENLSTPEPVRLATAMDDLDGIFLLGKSGTLNLYTVTNKKFQTNTLPLPNGAHIDAFGSYLTYLYTLDQAKGIIYRFPRAEGGFGEPVTWSKETLSLSQTTPLAVFENVALVLPDGHPALYSRGHKTGIGFGGTKTSLATKNITLDPSTGDLYALDPSTKRVIHWKSDGTLVNQYFSESFSDATALIVTKNILVIAYPKGITIFTLP